MAPVAVVTGAARGIGAATARALLAAGWSVVAVDACTDDSAIGYPLATRADLDAVAAAGATPAVADVRDVDALRETVALAQREHGGVDAAVAAAGVIGGGVPHWRSDEQTERALLDVNLAGVLNLARVAVPAMLDRPPPRHGRFVAVASAAASKGMFGLAAYSAAKAGVTGFVRGLAADLRGTGITANAVNPGSTRTDILDASAALYRLDSIDVFARQQPIERLIEPDEVAAAIAWLVSAAAGAVTGATYAVDGGLSL